MAPIQPRKSVAKDRFSALFSTLKTQAYYDPSARGPGSHAYVPPPLPPTLHLLLTSLFGSPSLHPIALPSLPLETSPLTFPFPHHSIRCLAFSPTGVFLATGSSSRTLRIWNPEKPSAKHSTELRGHTGSIERLAWNPVKESELASVSSDGTCRFWDVRSKSCRAVVQVGGEGLSVCWSADGGTVVVGRKVGAVISPYTPMVRGIEVQGRLIDEWGDRTMR